MRCRECLIELAQGAADISMLQPGEEAPKRADFVHWSEIIARTIAHGSSAEEIRGYLRTLAKTTWQLVNWLTHAKNAVRANAHIAVDGTAHVLTTFGTTLLRHEHGAPERCPNCSSYQVTLDFRPDLAADAPLHCVVRTMRMVVSSDGRRARLDVAQQGARIWVVL
jgi:hypothetical protein